MKYIVRVALVRENDDGRLVIEHGPTDVTFAEHALAVARQFYHALAAIVDAFRVR